MNTGAPAAHTVAELASEVSREIETVIEGKAEAVRLTVLTLLAGGHLLIEDVPGTGKTLLAKTLAATLDCTSNRVQFTPDLLPSDITGASIFNQGSREFEFRPGAVFTNVLLADEINRASPKTQSALLESMEEHAVSVDGTTHRLEDPFMVIATANPVDMNGTFDLPEAQRDRFLIKLSLGYPSADAEVRMLATQTAPGMDYHRVTPRAVTNPERIRAAIADVTRVYASGAILEFVVQLSRATREHRAVELGVSPRASVHLVRTAKAHAAMQGRDHVIPADVHAVITHVWSHRLHLNAEARARGVSASSVVEEIVRETPVTRSGSGAPAGVPHP